VLAKHKVVGSKPITRSTDSSKKSEASTIFSLARVQIVNCLWGILWGLHLVPSLERGDSRSLRCDSNMAVVL
jgi:hypothetical protein